MVTRATSKIVTFRRPFVIAGIDNEMPAGDYVVDTDEELLQELSFPAYIRVSTIIHLPGKPGNSHFSRALAIDSFELETAIARDRVLPEQRIAGDEALIKNPSPNDRSFWFSNGRKRNGCHESTN